MRQASLARTGLRHARDIDALRVALAAGLSGAEFAAAAAAEAAIASIGART